MSASDNAPVPYPSPPSLSPSIASLCTDYCSLSPTRSPSPAPSPRLSPVPSPTVATPQPEHRHQDFEIDLNFNNMGLVPYISPFGELKYWDRNDPEDYLNADEFKMAGTDEEREAALEAYRAWQANKAAEAKAAADKEEDEWYWEFTGMSACDYKAQQAREKASVEAQVTAQVNTPMTDAPHIPIDPALLAEQTPVLTQGEAVVPSIEISADETNNALPGTGTESPEADVIEDNAGLEEAIWAEFEDYDSKQAALSTQARDDDEDGGAPLNGDNPEPAAGISHSNIPSAEPSTPPSAGEGRSRAQEVFATNRKERNKEKRAAKKASQSSASSIKSPVNGTEGAKIVKPRKKRTPSAKKTDRTPNATTGAADQTVKPKRKYKPRAKESDQIPAAEPQLAAPPEETGNKDDGEADGDDDPTWDGFNELADEYFDAEAAKAASTATSPDQAHDLGDSPVRGSTSSLQTSLSPGAENEMDTDSDLGSEMTPEEWAAPNGEAPPPSSKGKGRKKSKAPKKKKGKLRDQRVDRADVIDKLRETLRLQRTTSLDYAVEHIQSNVAKKKREIFIDNSLSDVVVHGQMEAEDVMTNDDVSALPKVYHTHWRDGPNYRLLAKHMDLHNDIKLNDVYISLGLDVGRGKDIYEKTRALLGNPGCSLRVDGDLTDEHKLLVAERAHQLLAVVGWGDEHFQRPALTGKEGKDEIVGKVTWGNASTDILLGYCKILYKTAKVHEARRKGTNKRFRNAQPAVPEPSEPQEASLAEPPAPAPVAPVATVAAPGPAAPPGPSHAPNNATKRPHAVVDLTTDENKGVDSGPPPKRARRSAQHPRQIQNVLFPPEFFSPPPQSVPQSPHTLDPQLLRRQSQLRAQVEAYQRLSAQHNQAVPQYQVPQQSQVQGHQVMNHQGQQHPQVQYQIQIAQQPPTFPGLSQYQQSPQVTQALLEFQTRQQAQMMTDVPRPQRPEGLATQVESPHRPEGLATKFQSPQRPQMAPQHQGSQLPQMMPRAPSPRCPQGLARQFQSTQRPQMAPQPQATPSPWAHLQSMHNSPQSPQPQMAHTTAPGMQQQQRQPSRPPPGPHTVQAKIQMNQATPPDVALRQQLARQAQAQAQSQALYQYQQLQRQQQRRQGQALPQYMNPQQLQGWRG